MGQSSVCDIGIRFRGLGFGQQLEHDWKRETDSSPWRNAFLSGDGGITFVLRLFSFIPDARTERNDKAIREGAQFYVERRERRNGLALRFS